MSYIRIQWEHNFLDFIKIGWRLWFCSEKSGCLFFKQKEMLALMFLPIQKVKIAEHIEVCIMHVVAYE